MIGDRYPLHHRSEVEVDADAPGLFAHLDDHRRLALAQHPRMAQGREPAWTFQIRMPLRSR